MHRVVEANTHSLTLRLAGTFAPTDELYRRAEHAQQLNLQLLEQTKAAGTIRPDLVIDDLTFLFEQLASVRVTDKERTRQLRQRYLALHLQALHSPTGAPLPGPPPSWEEVSQRWQT